MVLKVHLTSRLVHVEILVISSYFIYTVTDLPFMSSNTGDFNNSILYQRNTELKTSDIKKATPMQL